MNIAQFVGVMLLGMLWGAGSVLYIFSQWTNPGLTPERKLAIRHHIYQVCLYLADLVREGKISKQEAELIMRVALVAVCRGNRREGSYIMHTTGVIQDDERN